MRVRVGCELVYESPQGAHMMATVQPRAESRYHKLVTSQRRIEPQNIMRSYTDGFGNEVWRIDAQSGTLKIYQDAVAEVPPTPDEVLPNAPKIPVENLPDEVMVYTLPSRYCQIEHFIGDAWDMFGHIQGGWAQVQAVCDWLHENVTYTAGSTPTTSSFEAYEERVGVCRDFAHLGIVFCRSLNIPARYVSGFLPDIGVPPDPAPMDFHAWFEAYIGGEWRTFDARHNMPRTGRVLIAYGRDAVDTAFSTSYGNLKLTSMKCWAEEVSEDFALPEPSEMAAS